MASPNVKICFPASFAVVPIICPHLYACHSALSDLTGHPTWNLRQLRQGREMLYIHIYLYKSGLFEV